MLVDDKFYNLVEAVVYVAMHAKPNAVRGPEICAAQGLPPRYLEADLQHLVRAGILKSVRGPKGGYVLAKERRNVLVGDIYRAMVVVDEVAAAKRPAAFEKFITPVINKAESELIEGFDKLSIEILCNTSKDSEAVKQKADFAI